MGLRPDLIREIKNLPKDLGEVLSLYYCDRCDFPAIAKILRKDKFEVQRLYHRAMMKLSVGLAVGDAGDKENHL